MVIWCDNIDTKEDFWKNFDDQFFLCILNYGFFLLSLLIIDSNM
jgi:hypothetical protein